MTQGSVGLVSSRVRNIRVDQHPCPPRTTAGVDAPVPLRRSVMTPSCPHLATGVHRHRLAIRRSAAVLVAALVIGGAPAGRPCARRHSRCGRGSAAGAALRRHAAIVARPARVDPGGPRAGSRHRPGAGTGTGTEPAPAPMPETPLEAVTRVLTDDLHVGRTEPACGGAAVRARDPRRRLVFRRDAGGAPQRPGGSPVCRSTCCPTGPSLPVRPPRSGRRCASASRTATTRSPTRPGSIAAPTSSIDRRGTRSPNATTRRSSASIPAAASPADQDAMALALYSERGARPWPHCGRHLR